MQQQSRKTQFIIVAAIVAIILLAIYAIVRPSPGHKAPGSPAPAANSTPVAAITAVVSQYLQAREDSVGADQTSPTAWLSTVHPLTTPAWFTSLQPPPTNSTGGVSADYSTAHSNGWTIQVDVSDCIWNGQPTATSGTVICMLTDTTVVAGSGAVVPASSLPFGWTHSGPQSEPSLSLSFQNGKWLIAGQTTSGSE